MIARRLFLLTIAVAAIWAAVALIPGDLERVAMFERDGRYSEALSELQRQYDSGRRGPGALIELYKLHVRFGDIDAAQKYLEEFSRTRPQDLQTQIALLKFYKQNSRLDEYLALLKSLNERLHTKALLTELLGYYRLTGQSVAEEDELEAAARSNRPPLSPSDLERLGLLAAARGDLQRAAKALRQADARRDPQARHGRQSLFQILLDLNATDEAEARALGWLRKWRDPELLADFMSSLARVGRWDLGVKLTDASGIVDDRTVVAGAELLAQGGRFDEARLRLAKYDAGELPSDPETLVQMTAVAAASGDAPLALRSARQAGFNRLDGETVGELLTCLEQHATNFGLRGLSPDLVKGLAGDLEPLLPPPPAPYSSQRLFAAWLAVQDGNSQLASRFLATVNSEQLSRRQRNELASLKARTGYSLGAEPRLAPRPWSHTRTARVVFERNARASTATSSRPRPTVTATLERENTKSTSDSGSRKNKRPRAKSGTSTETASVTKPASPSKKSKPARHKTPRHPPATEA